MSGLGQAAHALRISGRQMILYNSAHHLNVLNLQVGHSEAWLRAIFSCLSDDLALALRDAWMSSMIAHRASMLIAKNSVHNCMRRAFASLSGREQVVKVRKERANIENPYLQTFDLRTFRIA